MSPAAIPQHTPAQSLAISACILEHLGRRDADFVADLAEQAATAGGFMPLYADFARQQRERAHAFAGETQ